MFIEQLNLKSFKGFREFKVNLQQFTCLVGLNSRGKTSVLQAIQILYDIIKFAFGNKETPDFSSPQWAANPSQVFQRINYGDPDAIWLNKKTAEPCSISASLSGGINVNLNISGRNSYSISIDERGTLIPNPITPNARNIIENLFNLKPVYMPPTGVVSPSEVFMAYPQMLNKLNEGRLVECWRSQLHWLYNDGNKEAFVDIVNMVQRYLPDAKIKPPRLTHESNPKVLIEYEENGIDFDISTSGGGMRSILNLASLLHFSNSYCVLCDEPDSHLHPSLQNAIAQMLYDYSIENGRQIIVATHAPDFVASVPVESIVWIDRKEQESKSCNELSKVLIDLGAISKYDAIFLPHARNIIFLEGAFDKRTLSELINKSGCNNPLISDSVVVASLPNGKGDAQHLKTFQQLLTNVFNLNMPIACIVDNDYGLTNPDDKNTDECNVHIHALARKEIENYLIEPDVIERAFLKANEDRTQRELEPIPLPTLEQITEAIESILEQPAIKNTLRYQLMPQYRETLGSDLDPSTKEQRVNDWFEEQWKDKQWRFSRCPGKAVLKKIREWAQQKHNITLTNSRLSKSYDMCPDDIIDIIKKINIHFGFVSE